MDDAGVEMTDWTRWHEQYADDDSPLTRRLHVVQDQLHRWLDATSPRRVHALSLCAGDGRDLIGVLVDRVDRHRVAATLVELDDGLAARAREHTRAAGLDVDVRQGDAGVLPVYADSTPADLLLLAGVFGNISDDDVRTTIRFLPSLCAPAAHVIWTRHRNEPDLTPRIRGWFADAGFRELAFVAPPADRFTVGVHEYAGAAVSHAAPERLFTFFR